MKVKTIYDGITSFIKIKKESNINHQLNYKTDTTYFWTTIPLMARFGAKRISNKKHENYLFKQETTNNFLV